VEISDGWQLGLSAAIVSICVLLSLRQILRWHTLQGLRGLARHSYAMQRCFALIARIPADHVRNDVRRALGTILQHHLDCACKRRPGHPYLNAQTLRIAQFSQHRSGRQTSAQRPDADTLAALYELEGVFSEALADKVINTVEHLRAIDGLAASAAALETQLLKHKAQSATHLRRDGEALTYLKSALASAARIPEGEDERRELTNRIDSLESAH
jgi:hypothetical protein